MKSWHSVTVKFSSAALAVLNELNKLDVSSVDIKVSSSSYPEGYPVFTIFFYSEFNPFLKNDKNHGHFIGTE